MSKQQKQTRKEILEGHAQKLHNQLQFLIDEHKVPEEMINEMIANIQSEEMYVTRGLLNILRIYKPIIAVRCPKHLSPKEMKTLTEMVQKELNPDDLYIVAVTPGSGDHFQFSVQSILNGTPEAVQQLVQNFYTLDKESE